MTRLQPMSELIREIGSGLATWQLIVLLAAQGLGSAIWWFQNSRPDRLGGRISFIKAHWLAYAIVLWLLVPVLLATRHWTMMALAVSLAARGVVEVPLCLTKTWKVGYGMTHNVIHLSLCVVALIVLILSQPGNGFLLIMVVLTLLSVITEMIFVSWFRRATGGPEEGIYFVPGGEEYRRVNRATGWLFLPQYATFLAVLVINFIVRGGGAAQS